MIHHLVRWLIVSVSIFGMSHWLSAGELRPRRLRCEYLVDPLGIDVINPRLSWELQSSERGQRQTAYQVLVASTPEKLAADEGDLWDSGRVESNETIHVEYQGKPLGSRMRCHWKVRAWDKDQQSSAWSQPAFWTMGLMDPSDWQAKWMGEKQVSTDEKQPHGCNSPWLRKTFHLDGTPRRATVYVSSIGYHELYVNGRKVGDDVLSPAVSDYNHRVLYVTHDVTNLLHEGENCIALWLGRGWAAWPLYRVPRCPLGIAQLEIEAADAAARVIATDSTWRIHRSPVTTIGPFRYGDYGGERYDATAELAGWNTVGVDDSSWPAATVYNSGLPQLQAQLVQPNRKIETIRPIAVLQVKPGVYRVDMGRNFNGWVEVGLHASRGQKIELDYSERANEPRSFGQHDEYICSGDGDVFCSRFNYRTFRWLTITGVEEPPVPNDIRGWMIHTDYSRQTDFECSNELLNRIYQTVVWTYRCLSLGGYVVDCSHRERLGYGAEGQATMECGAFNSDAAAMFTKWLADWRDVQNLSNGRLSNTAPNYAGGGGPMWGAIVVTLPWQCYQHYGDRRVLQENYSAMQKWLAWIESQSKNDVITVYDETQYGYIGDWVSALEIDPPKKRGDIPHRARQFFNNCYWVYVLEMAGDIAQTIGKEEDAEGYRRKAEAVRNAVHREFFDPEGRAYGLPEQTYLAVPLLVDLPPKELRGDLFDRLANNILHKWKGHISSGVLGTYLQLKLLTQNQRSDLIFTMANQREYPGWGYMLDQGATTIWEYWDGRKSRNHTSFLSIGSWFIEGLAGIQSDSAAPGFKQIVIRPAIVGDLTFARAKYHSIHGPIESHWRLDGGNLTLNVSIPPNTTAMVFLPTRNATGVQESGQPVAEAKGVRLFRTVDCRWAVFRVESGRYQFHTPYGDL